MADYAGQGFTATVSEDGKTLNITVDLSAQGVPSKSGKSMVVASTRGNMSMGDVQVGLNVYRRIQ